MNQFQETLLILKHFENVIKARTNFCKRHANFTITNCVQKKIQNLITGGYSLELLKQEEIKREISTECSDIQLIIHNYLRLNIIDMFSFNDEYNTFFQEKITDDIKLAERIKKTRIINKNIREKINWDELKRFRNIALAHNLRDKKILNQLSIKTIKQIQNSFASLASSIEYSEIVIKMFENIECEFQKELQMADKSLKNLWAE